MITFDHGGLNPIWEMAVLVHSMTRKELEVICVLNFSLRSYSNTFGVPGLPYQSQKIETTRKEHK